MPKTRFTSIDIRALVRNLQQDLLGMRVANVYDINSKTYLFKMAKPDKKSQLLIESGIRFHTPDFAWEKSDVPSVFALKLRKYLRTKRLEDVQQLGVDRVVDFTFGSGPVLQHVIVELYASGNIILTDAEYVILALLRPYTTGEDVNVQIGAKYDTSTAKQATHLTRDVIAAILQTFKPGDTLRHVLNMRLDFGPEMIEHCLMTAGIEDGTVPDVDTLYNALQLGTEIFENLVKNPPRGTIVQKDLSKPSVRAGRNKKNKKQPAKGDEAATPPPPTATPETNNPQPLPSASTPSPAPASSSSSSSAPTTEGTILYEEFIPYHYVQYNGQPMLEFDRFDQCVDEFYSKLEVQKMSVARMNQETAVFKKLEKAKDEHQKRIASLQSAQITNEHKARLIETNLQDIDNCLIIVRSAVASSMDWGALATLIKEEKKRDPHSLANMIHKLKLEHNMVTLLLSEPTYEEEQDPEEAARKPELVDIDISLSAYANARKYFEQKKTSAVKAQKTIDHTEKALQSSERKARKALSEVRQKAVMAQVRKPYWFEKFHWFISSENYLVVGGKDMQQNEMLFKRYMEKDDLYVHAELHGAPTVIIKNHMIGKPVPPLTIQQAGAMTVCRSGAWDAKIVTSAWWVFPHQVSKTAPTGEYLTTGSFMIRGKKNILPPTQLIMGYGLLFRLEESSLAKHIGERSVRGEGEDTTEANEVFDEVDDSSDEGEGEKHLRKFERSKLKKAAMEEGGDEADESAPGRSTSEKGKDKVVPASAPAKPAPSVADKYKVSLVSNIEDDLAALGMQEEDQANEEEGEGEGQTEQSKKAKRLTARERRLLKQGKPIDTPKVVTETAKNEKEEEEEEGDVHSR
eukprot:TRINITY_DN5373_c0_g1_i4.p1 TRINITY_DN5373_c0_g1~~TRINITY_DN5373_c0_g1_i4.p1  ORF type:complete len:857 (-),score=278.84 TRINITY_DN5373_c0_g1_i4:50-2620(-)